MASKNLRSLLNSLDVQAKNDIISISPSISQPLGGGNKAKGQLGGSEGPNVGFAFISIFGKVFKTKSKNIPIFNKMFGSKNVKNMNIDTKKTNIKPETITPRSVLTAVKKTKGVKDVAPKGKGGKSVEAIAKRKAKKGEGKSRRVKVSDAKKNRRDRMSPDAKAAGAIGSAGLSAAIIAAGDQSKKRKKSKIPRPPSSTGVQDRTPIAKDKTPSSDAGTRGLPTGAKQRAVDKMDVASKRRRLQKRPAPSNRMAPPTGRGGDKPLDKARSGTQTFGTFKEAFRYYNNLPSGKKPATFTYKGKSYANVTKDQVKKAGFKTLRAYLNAQKKKK